MAFNGSGTYTLPAGNPVVTGTTISSSTTNTTNSDIATALTNCITRDGQSTPSANLPMNAKKLTGLAAGTTAGDSVRYEQVVLTGAALGTPTSGTLTSCTGLPLSTGVTGTLPVANGGTGSTSTTYCSLATNVTGTLPVGNGGTGTTTPSLVAGTNVTIGGTWPNQTINAATGGGGTVTSVSGTGTVNGISLSGTVTSSGSLTLGGTLSGVSLTSQVSGTLPVSNGGTGTTTPALVAGTNVTISGTWPNQTINASGGSAATQTALGAVYGLMDTGGSQRTLLGYGAGAVVSNANYATAVGLNTLLSLTTGSFNVAVGSYSLYQITTSTNNTACGHFVGSALTTGNNFTGLGYLAGASVTTGINNTIIGNEAGVLSLTTGSNCTIIGNTANASTASVSNEITLGNSSIATLRCQVTTITSLSDARDKTNIVDLNAGLNLINAVRPVAFDWNMRDGGKVGQHDTGFIAQELQSAQVASGINIPGLVFDDNPEKLEAGYSKLLPVMVKAIQELSAKIDALQAEITQLKGA